MTRERVDFLPRAIALAALLLALVPLASASAEPVHEPRPAAACDATARMPSHSDLRPGEDDAPPLVAPTHAPSAEVLREARSDAPPRPPSRRLPSFALEAGSDPALAPRPLVGRPADGVDVPVCRGAGRWCLAHASSTSPG